MIRRITKTVAFAMLLFTLCNCGDNKQQDIKNSMTKTNETQNQDTLSLSSNISKAPQAKKIDHLMSIHEHQRNDQYYWLRDDGRENKEVLDYLLLENAYTKTKLAHTEELQQKLYEEMTGRLEPSVESVPVFKKGYWYSSIYEKEKDYPIHIRQKGNLTAKHEILINENLRAKDFEYYQLADMAMSSNLNLLAISEDTVSRRLFTIRIKNLETNQFYSEVLHNTSGEIVWANDNKTIFYVKKDLTTLLPFQVYRHELGTPQQDDILIYQEDDAKFYTTIEKTRSEKFILIGNYARLSAEVRILSADTPKADFKLFLERESNHLFEVDHIGTDFYIQSDLDALNEKIWRVSENKIGSKEHWQEIVAHREDTLIQSFELFDSYMIVSERVKGLEKIRIRNFDGLLIDEIEFNDSAYNASFGENPDPSSKKFRYLYTSLNTPYSTFDYDLENRTSELKKQDKVIGNFHPDQYQTERLMIDAQDGKKIPISLVYRKDKFSKTGTNPILNYGYGSYGYTIDPSFSISRLSLLDRGFVVAISHIRGGKMLGRQWYEDGKKLNKMNTFTDFNDATRALIRLGYGDPKKTYAMGGSAGGLLMGTIINIEPELYHGVIAEVPFVDVVTTMLDESIPLTTGEFDEWGNPQDKKYYEYMLSYSPYDQVKKQNYPHLMVTTGYHDSQVQYWEPAKWVAKLRDLKTDNNLLLLDTDMEVGHGGKSGRYQRYHEQAKNYAFLLDLANRKE